MSAAELARELGVSHALASQHLRRLAAVELVELAEERLRRGGRERRYRATRDSSVAAPACATPLVAAPAPRPTRPDATATTRDPPDRSRTACQQRSPRRALQPHAAEGRAP
ncbi:MULTISPECIES: helix-turn-helix domain-containing protein [Streptomyces]|uniref:helix-turn-helix domain-containing protein n=1 Tax=Streptomyces TaxID=1883 RepID=UPI001E29A1C2